MLIMLTMLIMLREARRQESEATSEGMGNVQVCERARLHLLRVRNGGAFLSTSVLHFTLAAGTVK